MEKIFILDSTLRDGAQGEGISFSVEDKLGVVQKLDKLGIDYIEAGNPASNPKDMEFFERVKRLELKNSKLVAFGATCRRGLQVQDDPACHSLLSAGTEAVSIFGKCSTLHVSDVLKTTPEENLRMIYDTVQYFKSGDKEVLFDGEHFFDGYRLNPDYALRCLQAAKDAGADWLILCDTNGGTLPWELDEITRKVVARFGGRVGIHCHNDIGCAVTGSLNAVRAGARQVQGTFIGFGERCGNANLSSIIPNLQLKMGYACIAAKGLLRLTKTARYVADVSNLMLPGTMPYVGRSAFAHKGGMHVDGVCKNSTSFEHIDPGAVGNSRSLLLSEVSGRTAIAQVMSELDESITRESEVTAEFIQKLKEKEYEGYMYESAGASLEILARKQLGRYQPTFELEYFKIIGEQPAAKVERSSSALVKVSVNGQREITAAEGEGPVHALDVALRRALSRFYPTLASMRLIDYKVRVMETAAATAAKVRVLIESTDGENVWSTVGVSADIIDASWQALRDSIEYKLIRDQASPIEYTNSFT